jgi:hypothetical protein
MNILSELLPGARQIRTPLVIGYMWIFVAWINLTRIPISVRHSLLIGRAHQDVKHLSPVIVILILSFAAYIVGLFFELFDNIIVVIGTALAGLLLVLAISAGLLGLIIGFWPITIPIVGAILAISYRRTRRYGSGMKAELRQDVANIYFWIGEFFYALWSAIFRVWSNAKPVRDDLISDSIVKLMDQHPAIITKFCETLYVGRLKVACNAAGLNSESTSSFTNSDGMVVDASKAAKLSMIDPASIQILRGYLAYRLASSREVRRSVVLRVMNTADIRQLVDRAMRDAEAQIQVNQPSVFDTCDRLRAEGELRRGAAVPLAVALFSACAAYTSSVSLMLAAMVPAVFVYFSGLKKQEEAARIVSSIITARLTPITLEIQDTRLLQWQTHPISQPRKIGVSVKALLRYGQFDRMAHDSHNEMQESPVEIDTAELNSDPGRELYLTIYLKSGSKNTSDSPQRFAARLQGLASGLALAVRPAGLALGLRRSRVGPEDRFCGAVRNDLRVPLTLEGPARTMRGVPVQCCDTFAVIVASGACMSAWRCGWRPRCREGAAGTACGRSRGSRARQPLASVGLPFRRARANLSPRDGAPPDEPQPPTAGHPGVQSPSFRVRLVPLTARALGPGAPKVRP